MSHAGEPFLEYVGTWLLEMLEGFRRAAVFYAFLVGVSLFATVSVAAERDVGGAVACVAIACFFASNFLICVRRTRHD